MLASRLHRFLFRLNNPNPISTRFWLGLSLGFAVYYGLLGLQKAFRRPYIVQDDAREYVFWMQRFIDPTLFPHDLIADYFKSITPPGFAALYQIGAKLGIPPLEFSKFLPIVLVVITTLYGFRVCLQMFPIPSAGFVSMLLLNQSLWFKDDLASATPRAFIYPLFLAFLYYLLRDKWRGIWITIVLQALFYPPLVFITIGLLVLRLCTWERGKPRLQSGQIKYFVVAIVLGSLALILYAIMSSSFAPVITRAQAWTMPELHPGGRHPFFDPNPFSFWLVGEHSGIVPPLLPPLIWVGLLLPLVRNKSRFPLVQQIKPNIAVLGQLAIVSVALFFTAHAVLLRLFFPTRYTVHSFRIILAIAAGIVLTILLDALLVKSKHWHAILRSLAKPMAIVLVVVLIGFPALSQAFPMTNYRVSNEGALYEFFKQQPKDALIATLSDEGNNIPTFAHRSTLASKEFSLPFHLGYYEQIRQRLLKMIQAQYSPDVAPLQQTIQRYGITFWLLDRSAFTPQYLIDKDWLSSFQPNFTDAVTRLQQRQTPALATLIPRCSVFDGQSVIVLSGECLLKAK